jgi:hypothetical protein
MRLPPRTDKRLQKRKREPVQVYQSFVDWNLLPEPELRRPKVLHWALWLGHFASRHEAADELGQVVRVHGHVSAQEQ